MPSVHKKSKTPKISPQVQGMFLRAIQQLSSDMTRSYLARRAGQQYAGETGSEALRDIWLEAGYDLYPNFESYWNRWKRQDIARRIVNAFPDATWRQPPEIVENDKPKQTRFEKAWSQLADSVDMWQYVRRADILCNLDAYAVLYLGFDDAGISTDSSSDALSKPVTGATKLLYVRAFSKSNAPVHSYVTDPTSPQFGKPETYNIMLQSPGTKVSVTRVVHWTRIIHLAEDCIESDVDGNFRLEACINRLNDLEKILAADGEGFWRAAFSGLAAVKDPEYSWDNETQENMENQFQAWAHKLSRFMKLEGVDIKQITTRVASPLEHVHVMVMLISAATGIPARILTGSERGELASSQDEENWQARIDERRVHFAIQVVKQILDRCRLAGVLKVPAGVTVRWPLRKTSDRDRVEVAKAEVELLVKYADSPGSRELITPQDFLVYFLHKEEDEVRGIIDRGAAQPKPKVEEPAGKVPGKKEQTSEKRP